MSQENKPLPAEIKKVTTNTSDNNVKKAAKMILALGEENAAEILKHLDPGSIDKVVSEMIKTRGLDNEEKSAILREFKKKLEEQPAIRGGIDQAAKFLEETLGKEKADKHISNVKNKASQIDFTEIERFKPELISRILESELPQTSALILSSIKAPFAAKIMSKLDNAYRVTVSRKIATMGKVSPEVLRLAFENVLHRLNVMESQSPEELESIEGEAKLAEILNNLDQSSEDSILTSLGTEDPEMALRIKDKLRLFEDITQLTVKELRLVLSALPDQAIWAKALKGAGQTIISHIFSSVSANRASDIMSEMKLIENIPLKEIEKSRRTIMKTIETLEKEGKVLLRKDKETLI